MNNIELVLVKVEEELKNKNEKEAKTLLDIYKNLLYQFNRDGWNSDHKEFENNLIKHKEKLEELHSFVEKELQLNLKDGNYKLAHDITIIMQRIELSLHTIKSVINQLKNYKKLPQWTDKVN